MPWSVLPVSEIRIALVHEVESLHSSVAAACRKFGVSRKTAYKWLGRYRQSPQIALADRSRRPHNSPRRAVPDVEAAVLEVRSRFGWGPRKIRAFLRQQQPDLELPSERTCAQILARHGRIASRETSAAPVQFFHKERPNQMWQCDFKGPLEIARRKVHPFAVLDDHSRFLLALRPCLDLTMSTAFAVLWDAFGEFGLPESLLCDNAFGSVHQVPKTVSWFESRLIRLGIHPLHGRPYHPQTQGKVERFNRTLEDEVWPHVHRGALEAFDHDLQRWRREVYNLLRPHQALGDQPPLARYRPSPRPRPPRLPELEYPPGSTLRTVARGGDISWNGCRIQVGAGIAGERVRVEERDGCIALYYAWKEIRCLAHTQLHRDTVL
jgi:transposase InsO family protein